MLFNVYIRVKVKLIKVFGRYHVRFGRVFVFQAYIPVTIRRFLFITIIREVRLDDVDKRQKYPLGTSVMYKGTKYYYVKAGGDIICQQIVKGG